MLTIQIIETKALEQKALESQLAESRVENEKAKADNLTTREAILSEFAETMETELQCSICSELFIKVH
jgi:E3 ubiquitin-protein ligase RNF8